MDQHIYTQLLLLLDRVGNVLFDLLLVLICTDGALLELQTRPPDLCKTEYVINTWVAGQTTRLRRNYSFVNTEEEAYAEPPMKLYYIIIGWERNVIIWEISKV